MILLLISLLLVIICIIYITQEKELLSPSIWITMGYIFAALFGLININSWGDITLKTVLVITFAVFSFTLGGSFAYKIVHYRKGSFNKKITNMNLFNTTLYINNYLVIIMIIFMLYVSYNFFQYTYLNALIGGSPGGWDHMFTYARNAYLTDDFIPMSSFLNISLKLSQAFAFIMVYLVIHNRYAATYNKIRVSIKFIHILPMLIYLVQSLLNGGRTKMMYFILYIFIINTFYSKNLNQWSTRSNKKIIKWSILSITVGLSIFWLIDQTLRGSIYNSEWTLLEQMSKYIGSSLYALSIYLIDIERMGSFTESETLFPIFSIINKFGGNIEFRSNVLEYVTYGISTIVDTNIYTALRRYIHDYGLSGLFFIQFIQGFIYQFAFEKIKTKRKLGLPLIYYASMAYPVAFSFIEERFFNDILTLNMFITVLLIFIFWRYGIKKIYISEEEKRY